MPKLIDRSMEEFTQTALFDRMNRKQISLSLKRCPLCDSINARSNMECFTCRWAGEFDYSEAGIRSALDALVDRCPELSGLAVPAPTETLGTKIRRMLRRRIDYRA